MFLHQNDSTTTTRNNQTAQKSQKEKTMAASPAHSLADIDVTKPLTQEEQLMVLRHNEEESSTTSHFDVLSDYYPGKYSENNFEEEDAATKGFITSFVGSCTSENGTPVNLGEDVALVQKHLNRLGILSNEDYANEKPKTNKEICKNELTATIEAIGYFQERVMHTAKAKVDKQVWPGYETIKSLTNITLTESRTKLFKFTQKQIRKKIEETRKEMAEAQVAEIERIKNEPATDENVQKCYEQADDIEEFGRLLKYYALYNPTFVIKAIDLVGYGDDDNLTRAIMRYLNDDEIQQLSSELDTKFYDSMATGVTTDEEYELMKKLKKGRGVKEESVKKDRNKKEQIEKKDLQLVEKGEELLKNKYYHKQYAYLPFTGPKTGKKYVKGDYIDEKDRIATYGSKNKPTWCNLFAQDLMKEVLNKDPFDGIKSAKQIYNYMINRPEEFIPINTGFEDAWNNEINKNEIVFLVDEGHIAIGVPTVLDPKIHKRTYLNNKNETVIENIGFVIQAGSSHGHMILSQAWAKKDFKNIKMFKYVSKE